MEFDLENPLTISEDFQIDTIEALFANELDHMPSLSLFISDDGDDHLRFSLRCQAFFFISRAQNCYNVDPFITYLAINYVDRFITKTKFMKKNLWIMEILAISSLSLAAKMRNIDVSASLTSLQRDGGFFFDLQSIHRMEVLILTTLDWRMRSITPFSFIKFFLSLFKIKDSSLAYALKLRTSHIIFNSHKEMKLLEYKPSVIATSAFLCATQELILTESSSFEAGIFSCEYINKEVLLKCLNVMQEMMRIDVGCELGSRAVSTYMFTPKSVIGKHHRRQW